MLLLLLLLCKLTFTLPLENGERTGSSLERGRISSQPAWCFMAC